MGAGRAPLPLPSVLLSPVAALQGAVVYKFSVMKLEMQGGLARNGMSCKKMAWSMSRELTKQPRFSQRIPRVVSGTQR